MKMRFGLRALLAALVVVALLLAACRFLIVASREAALQTNCRGHFSQIQMALLNYDLRFGCFPPAYVSDSEGKRMHSWRVLILPDLGQQSLFQAYDFDEPWDGLNNRRLWDSMPDVFRCPSELAARPRHLTNYVAIVGEHTAFPGPRTSSRRDLPDSRANTLLVVEVSHMLVNWMEPVDLDADDMSFQINDRQRPSLSSVHRKGPGIICVRSSAWRLNPKTPPDIVRSLVEGEPEAAVTVEKLVQQRWLQR